MLANYRTTQNENQMARDLIHEAIKNALINNGWEITDEPLFLLNDNTKFFIDIGARKFLTAKRDSEEITGNDFVVKSFDSIKFRHNIVTQAFLGNIIDNFVLVESSNSVNVD